MKKYLILIIQLIASYGMAFEAHEWGTFTSLVGSDGKTQNGMYHEDEVLPDFVHGFGVVQPLLFDPFPNTGGEECPIFTKSCFSFPVLQSNFVSQKMETPVIYFYGDKQEYVTVDVSFPEGIITETFPAPISSSPSDPMNLVMENGQARFEVELLPNSTVQPPEVEPGNIYGYARNTDSLMVRTRSEYEKFIFYRGLGRFQPTFQITSSGGDINLLIDRPNKPLAGYLVFVDDQGGKPSLLKIIGDDAVATNPTTIGFGVEYYNLKDKFIHTFKKQANPDAQYGGQALAELTQGLVEAGLKFDEAAAMVQTWKNGYFKTPGLRLLYILPKDEVDRILPVDMSPQPEKFERVFVARIELMTQDEEFELVRKIMSKKSDFDIDSLGRFAESQLRRAEQVYLEQHQKAQPDIQNFQYNLHKDFAYLISKSMTGDTAPIILE